MSAFFARSAFCRRAPSSAPPKRSRTRSRTSSANCSTPLLEEILEQDGCLGFTQSAIDFRPVMAGRRGKELHAIVHRAALGVGGAVIQPADAGKRHGAGAHGAGFERDIEVAAVEAFSAERGGSLPDRDQFGMRGRIAVGKRAVPGPRDDFAGAHDHTADRHFATLAGGAGFLDCHIHKRSLVHERCHERSVGPLSPTLLSAVIEERTMDGNSDQHKPGERIAKVIARAGLASRREAEDWIVAGRVAVNGEVIRSAARNVTDRDRVNVDGEPLPERERTRLFLYHKPRGLITTHADPQGRPTIFQKLPKNLPRLISIGRLDYNTEGLLLLTNDGALARVLELPATGWLRRYRVRAHGAITQDRLDALRGGVTISGIHYGAIDATLERTQGSNLWLTFAIREGKNREVRTILAHLDLEVTRLIRVSFGPFQLAELDEGAVEEVKTRVLREQLGDKLVAQADLDLSAPVIARAEADAPRRLEPHRGDRPRVTPWSKKPSEKLANERPKQKRRSKGAEHA